MANQQSRIEDVIAELGRAGKFLGRIKVPQVRNAEQRDFLKATALSWFHTHRPSLAPALPPELMDAAEEPYRAFLNATDRNSAKGIYVTAVRSARAALIAACNHALVPATTTRNGDTPPVFGPLAADLQLEATLTLRWEECTRYLQANAPLAGTFMMGGILEALFVSRAIQLANDSDLFRSTAAPIDGQTKRARDSRQWTLAPYIDVGHDLGWISRSAKDVAAILRAHRNYVHFEKERAHAINISADDAAMLWEITKTLSKEPLATKGTI